jgi:hypothetical protein
VSERPLWSERHGGSLPLTQKGYFKLVERLLERCTRGGLFEEAFAAVGFGEVGGAPAKYDPDEFFTHRLGDPWAAGVLRYPHRVESHTDGELFDLLELLHREVVSSATAAPKGWNQTEGQRRFRESLNPILARRDPPLEMDATGTIVQRVAEPFRRLVEQSLPETAPKREVVDRVDDAVSHFRRRDATAGDRRAAVRELADVLEFLREDVKLHLPSKDERDLFRLANEFALRHNKPTTRRDFEEPTWLAWTFYVYLATIRLTLELSRRRQGES